MGNTTNRIYGAEKTDHVHDTRYTPTSQGGNGTVTNVSSANADIGVASPTTTPILTVNSATAPTASKVAKWDANANFSANNTLNASVTVAQGATSGTTVLVVGSTFIQRSTGSAGQIYTLPVTSTLAVGQSFVFVNVGTGILTINSSGGNLVISVLPGSTASVTVNAITGTSATSWDAASLPAAFLVPNAQTGTTYTILATDNGRQITFNNASAIAVTVPTGLGAGFSCVCVQIGAGQVTFTGSGLTVHNRSSFTKIAGQYGVCTLIAGAADAIVLAGDGA